MDEPVAWTGLVLNAVITTWWIARLEVRYRNSRKDLA